MSSNPSQGEDPDLPERGQYAAQNETLAGMLDLRAGLAEAINLADYVAADGHLAQILDLPAGLRSALAARDSAAANQPDADRISQESRPYQPSPALRQCAVIVDRAAQLEAEILFAQLKGLRSGRGLRAPNLERLVGPVLRKLCDIDDSADTEAVRDRVRNWVLETAEHFPEDLRLVITTSLGMNPEVQRTFLAERVAWLVKRLDRDARTVRRRMDAGLARLVEAALGVEVQEIDHGNPWRLQNFSALLRLDGLMPVCTERRTIVAIRNGVDRISWSISLPKSYDGPVGLDIQVLQGAILAKVERPSRRHFRLQLRLPYALRAGQTHSFSLDVCVPLGQQMPPTYVFWPKQPCDRFDLVVRFHQDRLPRLVWRVSDAFHLDGYDEPGPDRLRVDNAGEVSTSFIRPRMGRGYGVQWEP